MQFDPLKRREFITLLGAVAVAWPLAARAQQQPMPVVGFLGSVLPDSSAALMRDAFRQGLKDTGYIEGQNVSIEFRSPEKELDQLPGLATELVRRGVALIAAPGGPAPAFAAKAATTTIPIVFLVGEDPVGLGLVASLARPGGNLTGINFFVTELTAKRLELLRELVPTATRIAALVNPSNAANTKVTVRDIEAAARAMGLQIEFLEANTSREIDAAFTTFARASRRTLRFFLSRRLQLACSLSFCVTPPQPQPTE